MTGTTERRPLFLDRDGTLIRDENFLKDAAALRLLDGVPAALHRFIDAGFVPVVITNQSGIARGILTEQDYRATHAELVRQLDAHGVELAAEYHCPHHPDFPYEGVTDCDCRKPGTLLHQRASAELGLDPARGVFIGDRWRDVVPAREFGGRGILVPSEGTPADEVGRAVREAEVASDLGAAASLVLDPQTD